MRCKYHDEHIFDYWAFKDAEPVMMTCARCATPTERKSGNQKYCAPCCVEVNREHRRQRYIARRARQSKEDRGGMTDKIYMVGFTPHGACRAETRCDWPEGTAYTFNLFGEMICAARDLQNRGWSLGQFVRLQCGIASRQCTSISFACDSANDIDVIAKIVSAEFPDLVPDQRYPAGRCQWP